VASTFYRKELEELTHLRYLVMQTLSEIGSQPGGVAGHSSSKCRLLSPPVTASFINCSSALKKDSNSATYLHNMKQ